MNLAEGARLGPYEILSALGAGGMGEVYRARDTRLDRTVALKVLPNLFASDPERLARFEREAKTLAALNHPHIAQIYGLEQAAGVHALAMELVEGEDLATRLSRGRLPWSEVLPIARQIADALESAHEKGIIHRDLKPANIALTTDGQVKVLDFGLAKVLERPEAADARDAVSSPTITSPAAMTAAGMVLGTAAYMSPEQAHGRAADKRSDVWAFGCVLYEMLTGTRAFPGDDVIDTLAGVVKGEPDWSAWAADVPPPIRLLAQQCLVKDRRERVSDIAAVRYVLQHTASDSFARSVSREQAVRSSRERWFAAAAAILFVVAAVLTATVLRRPAAPQGASPIARLSITDAGDKAPRITGLDRDLALTPDGSRVVYVTRSGRLAIRAMDEIEPKLIEGTDGARAPFISPDGQWIGFWAGGLLRKVPIDGGTPTDIAHVAAGPRGIAWAPDGRIIYSTATGSLQHLSTDGKSEALTDRAAGEQAHAWPSLLPDGRAVLFAISTAALDRSQIAVLDLRTHQRKVVLTGGTHPIFVEPGYLVFRSEDRLMAVPFDRDRLDVAGIPVPMLDHLGGTRAGGANADVARNGTLAYISGGILGMDRSLVWVDRSGQVTPTTLPRRAYVFPRLSPDGGRVVVDARDHEQDIWIGDLHRDTLMRLTISPALDQFPVWLPDGQHVLFASARDGALAVYRQAADGTGVPSRVMTGTAGEGLAISVLPGGRRIVFRKDNRLALMDVDTAGSVETLSRTTASELNGEVSPDGAWLAYESYESGQTEVYVRPFPRVESGRWQVSTAGGLKPAWARNGRELFYQDLRGSMMAASIAPGPIFAAGVPLRLFDTAAFFTNATIRTWDVGTDGRFLMIQESTADSSRGTPAIVVVLNWIEELKALVPLPR